MGLTPKLPLRTPFPWWI